VVTIVLAILFLVLAANTFDWRHKKKIATKKRPEISSDEYCLLPMTRHPDGVYRPCGPLEVHRRKEREKVHG